MNEENNIVPIKEELNVVKQETENIKSLIYNIRGKQVMLDSDVARFTFMKQKTLIYDAYSLDDSILMMLAKKNKNMEVVILTSQNCNIFKLDINKFNKQYPTLKIARTNKFHDGFIVIGNKELYHCRASLKDLGKKCFANNKMENIDFIKNVENSMKLC